MRLRPPGAAPARPRGFRSHHASKEARCVRHRLVALTIGAAPILTSAADHLDAPALGGTSSTARSPRIRSTATATSTTSTCSSAPDDAEPHRHRDDRQPGHQPVRRQLRHERPLHAEHRHERGQQSGHRLRRRLRDGRSQGQPALRDQEVHRAATTSLEVGHGTSRGKTNDKAKNAGPKASRSGPASAPIRSSSI